MGNVAFRHTHRTQQGLGLGLYRDTGNMETTIMGLYIASRDYLMPCMGIRCKGTGIRSRLLMESQTEEQM